MVREEVSRRDFKYELHTKTGDLIKDIICLAISPRHDGDRYIIYCVEDTVSVVGLQSASHQTQAGIVNTLSNAGFAGESTRTFIFRKSICKASDLKWW